MERIHLAPTDITGRNLVHGLSFGGPPSTDAAGGYVRVRPARTASECVIGKPARANAFRIVLNRRV